ncbi:MAG: tRNA lysidine(34) synthetase TilS [Alphaproteobacteria bacterium]
MLNTSTFSQQMAELGLRPDVQHFYVACSGGVDSLCLTLLVKQWLGDQGNRLTALIVDHQLRDSSECEALQVQTILKQHGIKTKVLSWAHEPITSGVENKARDARYELIQTYIKSQTHKAPVLLTGHHRDDQHETLLMRLDRGTKLRGLSGMSSLVETDGVTLARPLLTFEKAQIHRALQIFDAVPVEDPSNDDLKLTRNWLRANRRQFEKVGLGQNNLCEFQTLAGKLRRWTEQQAVKFIEYSVELNELGFAVIDHQEFLDLPKAVQEDVLLRLINWLNPQEQVQSVAHASIKKLIEHGASVNAVRTKISGDKLYVFPEARRVFNPDKSCVVSTLSDEAHLQGYNVGILGKKRAQMYRQHMAPHLPSYILAGLVVLEHTDKPHVFAVPQLEFENNINQMPSLCNKFGLMRNTEPSKQIFAVVSAKDSLT